MPNRKMQIRLYNKSKYAIAHERGSWAGDSGSLCANVWVGTKAKEKGKSSIRSNAKATKKIEKEGYARLQLSLCVATSIEFHAF